MLQTVFTEKILKNYTLFTKVSEVYYLTYLCFGHIYAHHQELRISLTSSGFTVGAWW
jgi:hypothetical protein